MTTFNRLYRAPKLQLCIHTGNEDLIDFEPAEYRKTQYTFVSYGTGTFHAFTGDNHDVVTNTGDEELLDFRKFINVIVIIVSGLVATFGFNYIPYKAYVIVAALAGLFTAFILTKVKKNYE